MPLRLKMICGAAISLTLTSAVTCGSALARQDESASPLNQIYRVAFGSAPPIYGGAISFSFGDGLIVSYTEKGFGGLGQTRGARAR